MASITHFSHEHPLHLLQQKPTEKEKRCYACQVALTEEREHLMEVYGCKLCKEFFLHKHCAQLPLEIVHKLHENHSLFLVLNPTGAYNFVKCQSCRLPLYSSTHRFFYYCYLCKFMLDTDCAFREKEGVVTSKKELGFHHSSHKHELMVQPKPASFLCDACGVKGEDMSYQCSQCHYWIHKRCAMLPSTTTLNIHSHPLSLAFGLPSQYADMSYMFFCDVCEDKLFKADGFWLYYCNLCRYFVHVGCMNKKKEQIEVDLKGLIIKDLPHLPGSDKSVELIGRFLLGDNNADIQPEISIFSHKHPLVCSNDQFLEDGEEILCDACIEPIFSPPYYHCAECNYFLHLTCAKLPNQLQHHLHSHQLILASKTRFDEMFHCYCCERKSNGFFYHCTGKVCEFYLDLRCAALSKVIIHENHNHPLFYMTSQRHATCKGCGVSQWDRPGFHCRPCKYYLHVKCVLLPKTTKSRFDSKHPLTLRFPPHAYHPEPFDCYECETEIDPRRWLYHCKECDLSFHVGCVNPGSENFNMKFGQKVQIGCHPHPLKYVNVPSVKSSICDHCKERGSRPCFTFECETCNFLLCTACLQTTEALC